jgi:hypothetical protein
VAHLAPVRMGCAGTMRVASSTGDARIALCSAKVQSCSSFSRSFSTRICSPTLARAPEPGARSRRGTPRCARGDPDRLKGAAARWRGSPPVPRELPTTEQRRVKAGEGRLSSGATCTHHHARQRAAVALQGHIHLNLELGLAMSRFALELIGRTLDRRNNRQPSKKVRRGRAYCVEVGTTTKFPRGARERRFVPRYRSPPNAAHDLRYRPPSR